MKCIKSKTDNNVLVFRLVRELGDGFACDLCNAEIAGPDGISAKQSGLFGSELLCADCWGNNEISVFYPVGYNMLEESKNWR